MYTLSQLSDLMASMDWNYQSSDDSFHWQRSDQMLAAITRMSYELLQTHETAVNELWKKYTG